ncbi:hypothetical protein JCM18902_2545 [Psychrobacter sp. JCM 18902]|nr:hypothetical protein JCM18902_2545 [Psychrobacter sp. JCM 18902]
MALFLIIESTMVHLVLPLISVIPAIALTESSDNGSAMSIFENFIDMSFYGFLT